MWLWVKWIHDIFIIKLSKLWFKYCGFIYCAFMYLIYSLCCHYKTSLKIFRQDMITSRFSRNSPYWVRFHVFLLFWHLWVIALTSACIFVVDATGFCRKYCVRESILTKFDEIMQNWIEASLLNLIVYQSGKDSCYKVYL